MIKRAAEFSADSVSHQTECLGVRVPVQLADNQALREVSRLGSIDRLGDGAFQLSNRLIDGRTERQGVMQASNVAHAPPLSRHISLSCKSVAAISACHSPCTAHSSAYGTARP